MPSFGVLFYCEAFEDWIARGASQSNSCVAPRFVTDDVGSTLFGVECEALQRPGNAFHAHCAEAFTNSAWRRLRQRLLDAWPGLAVRIPYRSSTAAFFQVGMVRDHMYAA